MDPRITLKLVQDPARAGSRNFEPPRLKGHFNLELTIPESLFPRRYRSDETTMLHLDYM